MTTHMYSIHPNFSQTLSDPPIRCPAGVLGWQETTSLCHKHLGTSKEQNCIFIKRRSQ